MENYFVIYVILRGCVLFEIFFYLVYDYSGSGYYSFVVEEIIVDLSIVGIELSFYLIDVLLIVLLNFLMKLVENFIMNCFCGCGVVRKVRENEFCKMYKLCCLCY